MGLGVKLDFNSRRAGIPSAYDKGATYNVNPGVSGTVVGTLDQPMLAVLKYCFTLGDLTVGANSVPNAATMAALEYYNYVRSKNVSLSSFTANDLFKITIAIAELYAMHSELVRDFKLNFKIDFENVAFNTLMSAEIGFPSFNTDLSNIAARLNKLGNDLKKFPMLKGIAAFDDLLYVASHLFADDQINKAGTIMFAKDYILEYDTVASSSTVGSLKYTSIYSMNYISKLAYIENLVRLYAADEDVSRVCTEILKAETGLYTYPIEVLDLSNLNDCAKDLHRVFDWEIYDRISNATIYPIKTTFATTTIAGIQENNQGVFLYGIDTVTNYGTGAMQAANFSGSGTNTNQYFRPDYDKSWVLSHSEDPSEEAVVQFLAHHEHIESANDASNRYFNGLSILHINEGLIRYVNGSAGNNVTSLRFTTLPHTISDFVWNIGGLSDVPSSISNWLKYSQLYDSFGCLPPLWLMVFDSSSSTMVRVLPKLRDIDNFANIDTNTLVNIKAVYSRGALFISPDDQDSRKSGRFSNKSGNNNKNNKNSKGKGKQQGAKTPNPDDIASK